jgi:hypothetical protein
MGIIKHITFLALALTPLATQASSRGGGEVFIVMLSSPIFAFIVTTILLLKYKKYKLIGFWALLYLCVIIVCVGMLFLNPLGFYSPPLAANRKQNNA